MMGGDFVTHCASRLRMSNKLRKPGLAFIESRVSSRCPWALAPSLRRLRAVLMTDSQR